MLAKAEPQNDGYYILRSVGRTDKEALAWLDRFGIDTYYPVVMEMRKVPRRQLSATQRRSGVEIKKPQLSPLFPKYIFARMEMAKISWRDLFKFAGLGGMLCEGDLPVKVKPELINKIRARENNGVVAGSDSLKLLFDIGDEVMVTDGPFASFPGIVEHALDCAIEDVDPETRIVVAVNIFGRATPVELEHWQVAKR